MTMINVDPVIVGDEIAPAERTLVWAQETPKGRVVAYHVQPPGQPPHGEVGTSVRAPDGSLPEPARFLKMPVRQLRQFERAVHDLAVAAGVIPSLDELEAGARTP